MKSKNDPKNYEAMSVPHETQAAAEEDIEAFYIAVRKLRKKHNLTEVLCVVATNVTTEAEPTAVISYVHFGDPRHGIRMAAHVIESERERYVEILEHIDQVAPAIEASP